MRIYKLLFNDQEVHAKYKIELALLQSYIDKSFDLEEIRYFLDKIDEIKEAYIEFLNRTQSND